MKIETFQTGELQNNTYLVYCPGSKKAFVVDPVSDSLALLKRISDLSLKVSYIINTHTHYDHISGNNTLLEATNAMLITSKIEAPYLLDPKLNFSALYPPEVISRPAGRVVDDGEEIILDSMMGPILFTVLLTPGHSPGHICLKFHRGIFTGDLLFKGSIGRTDLPGGNTKIIAKSLLRLWDELPDGFDILPGHMCCSNVTLEKKSNYLWRHMVS